MTSTTFQHWARVFKVMCLEQSIHAFLLFNIPKKPPTAINTFARYVASLGWVESQQAFIQKVPQLEAINMRLEAECWGERQTEEQIFFAPKCPPKTP